MYIAHMQNVRNRARACRGHCSRARLSYTVVTQDNAPGCVGEGVPKAAQRRLNIRDNFKNYEEVSRLDAWKTGWAAVYFAFGLYPNIGS